MSIFFFILEIIQFSSASKFGIRTDRYIIGIYAIFVQEVFMASIYEKLGESIKLVEEKSKFFSRRTCCKSKG